MSEIERKGVSSSTRGSLLRLQASCRDLMRTVLACPVGAASVQNAELGGGAGLHHVTLLREKLKAEEELFRATTDYEQRQRLAQDPLDTEALLNTTDASTMLETRIEELRGEVTALSSKYSQDGLLLDCLQKSSYIVQHLFPGRDGQLTSNSRALGQMMEQQAKLVSEVLHTIKTLERLQVGVKERCRQQMEVVQCCRRLMHQIQSSNEQTHPTDMATSDDPDHESLVEEVKQVTAREKLLRHTLQCLIFGSGVNWAEDEDLLELTLSLGNAQI